MDYQFEVIRIWERAADDFLSGDVGMLPLAVLGRLPAGVELETALRGVIQQLIDRLQREAAPEQVRRLLTAAFVLTGLRVPRQRARQLFQGVRAMRESDTYMAIIDEGRLEELKKLILRWGQKKLGNPDEVVTTFLAGSEDIDRLELLLERIAVVETWQELLATS
jgi:predicted transposase YdaD